MAITIQTGAHQFNSSKITQYALTLGGLNTTNAALKQWDPLLSNYPRLFMVRKPLSMTRYFEEEPEKFNAFKHLLEYGNLGVSGLSTPTIVTTEIKGGYGGKSFEIPTGVEDSTNEFTVKLLELAGSPVREILHTWINSVVDFDSGLLHYNGLVAAGQLGYSQANHTAEFIFVSTDRTGMKVEYACHLTNCFPKEVPTDHFNADDPSQHDKVEIDVKFTCTKREGIDVNEKAKKLLMAHQIMTNSLEYCTGLTDEDVALTQTGYNPKTGLLETREGRTLKSENEVNNNKYRCKLTTSDANELANGVAYDHKASQWQEATPSYTTMGNQV